MGGRQVFPLTHSHGMWLFTGKREVWASRAGLGRPRGGRDLRTGGDGQSLAGGKMGQSLPGRLNRGVQDTRCPPIDAASLS